MIQRMLDSDEVTAYLKLLSDSNRKLFISVLKETASSEGSRLVTCSNFIQHGKTSVLLHVITVSIMALYLAQRLGIEVHKRELIRGALLHDYFMYDWHEKSWANSIHGYTHPGKALRQAEKDFALTERERNMILRHMFPLTPTPPKYRESLLLCLADKIVATRETIHRR